MSVHAEIRQEPGEAVTAAAELLAGWIEDATAPVRNLMVAGGNTPLPLYAALARRGLATAGLRVYVLDEYVGVPKGDPRTCTNLLREAVASAWRIPLDAFHGLESEGVAAGDAVVAHERRIAAAGGLDAIVLGLGRNGHLGFNEPGSARDSGARVVDLDAVSIEANRAWFAGEHAPRQGATVGLRTILAARRVLLLAFGGAKADAVHAMLRGPRSPACPASFLQDHPDAHVFLDERAAARIA